MHGKGMKQNDGRALPEGPSGKFGIAAADALHVGD